MNNIIYYINYILDLNLYYYLPKKSSMPEDIVLISLSEKLENTKENLQFKNYIFILINVYTDYIKENFNFNSKTLYLLESINLIIYEFKNIFNDNLTMSLINILAISSKSLFLIFFFI